MKKILIILLFILTKKSFSQEFMGIKIDGSKYEILSKFKQKGFKVEEDTTDNLEVVLTGIAGSTSVTLCICFTPISKKAYSIFMTLPEIDDWISLKRKYEEFVYLFTEKYGLPNLKTIGFLNPYKEGDGNEMKYVNMKKCNYNAFWNDHALSITSGLKRESGCVLIVYTNEKNQKIFERETKEINLSVF